jgi:hypothetical protein
MGRLMLFGCISQIPYIILVNKLELNILFSFLLTTGCFYLIRKTNKKILILVIGMITAQLLGVSYGWYAVACPLLMLNFKGAGDRMWWIWWIVTNIIDTITSNYPFQIYAIFTPLILAYHNPAKNRKPTAIEKKFFYYFYPIHLAGLASLKAFLL